MSEFHSLSVKAKTKFDRGCRSFIRNCASKMFWNNVLKVKHCYEIYFLFCFVFINSLFYTILGSIPLGSILLLGSTMFYTTKFYTIRFYNIRLYTIRFYTIKFYTTKFYIIMFYSTKFYTYYTKFYSTSL